MTVQLEHAVRRALLPVELLEEKRARVPVLRVPAPTKRWVCLRDSAFKDHELTRMGVGILPSNRNPKCLFCYQLLIRIQWRYGFFAGFLGLGVLGVSR